MTRAAARRPATSWKAWAWLPLAMAVIEVLILVGLLPKGWTGVVVTGAVALTSRGRVYDYSRKLRVKLLNR
jgi:hypothetical protein